MAWTVFVDDLNPDEPNLISSSGGAGAPRAAGPGIIKYNRKPNKSEHQKNPGKINLKKTGGFSDD